MVKEDAVKAPQKTLIRDTPGDRLFMAFVYAVLGLILVIVIFPLVYIISASFSDPQAVISGRVWFLPVNPTVRGYQAVFKNPKLMSGFYNSFYYMIAGTALNLIMTLLCAFPLTRKEFRARNVLSVIMVFTMYFSGGMVPTYMVVKKLGLIDTRMAMIVPVALSVWNVILCRTYISSTIPDTLYESATLDGCTPFRFMVSIVAPLSAPILAVLALYYGVAHWNTYFNALIYLNKAELAPLQIVLREILVLSKIDPIMITDARELAAKQGLTDLLKYSVIVVGSAPVMAIYPFVQKYFVKGVMIGAVKG
ncbi:MAG: carbohydrate ABC transporter permease [Spirochaetaceae bacterium]|jgi:multiple sugar transport system permease protein/putative aldouronate transport system permease protein|nr:carbohydrate ABC transporter permease [Spirochaetaceae bacterium]